MELDQKLAWFKCAVTSCYTAAVYQLELIPNTVTCFT